jgi:Ca2+-binding EF-hand superfamily protein
MKPAARQRMKHMVIVLAAAFAGCSPMERAASPDVVRAFRALDRDGDGFVSREEARRDDAVARAFDLADRKGDGKLDPEEFRLIPR